MDVEPPIQGVKLRHCMIHAWSRTNNTSVTLLTESKEYSSSQSRFDISVKDGKKSVSNSCIVPYGTFSSEMYTTASHEKSMERLKNEIERAKVNPVKAK